MMLSLERIPNVQDLHVWSDYIELLCLMSPDHLISATDVIDRLNEDADLDTNVAENNLEHYSTVDEGKNALERKTADWFRHLEFRSGIFQEYGVYPFIISADRNTLYRKPNLTTDQKFYIFLLLAANLRYVNRSLMHRITHAFEEISHQALKNCLPAFAEVHIFGAGSASNNSKYQGNLWRKLNLLAEDLYEQVRISEEKLSVNNTGDGGLDLVAWLPMNDLTSGMLVIFGQCACTEEWVTKQHSSSYASWNSKLSFTVPPCNIIFIPFCFRDTNGGWNKPQDVHQSIIVDRVRIVYLLQKNYSFFESLPIYKEVEKVILATESLV